MSKKHYIVDTNVCIVANFQHEDIACIKACVNKLIQIKEKGKLVLDSNGCILAEYRKHKSQSSEDVGNNFIIWAQDNQYNTDLCELVNLTPKDSTCNNFREFPKDSQLKNFDQSDRKFVAVALASKNNPTVINATDSRSWWKYKTQLSAHGINLEHLCKNLMS